MAKSEPEAKRIFRQKFYERLSELNLTAVAEKTGIARNTLYSWATPLRGLPDIWEAKEIAEAGGKAPAELAFDDRAPRLTAEEIVWVHLHRSMTPEQQSAARQMHSSLLSAVERARLIQKTAESVNKSGDIKRLNVNEELRPIEDKPLRTNTRDEFPVFTLMKSKPRPKARPMPHYLDLAAGSAKMLEKCEDLNFVREWSGEVHSGTVVGDSMIETVRPGDRIALEPCNAGEGHRLEPLKSGERSNPIHVIQQKVPNNSICAVSLSDAEEEITLKRVRYQRNADGTWFLQIVADNPDAYVFGQKGFYTVGRKDGVVFWARMVGFIGTRAE
jgi:hypothetical protein